MNDRSPVVSLIVVILALLIAAFGFMILNEEPVAVVCSGDASSKEKLAAREIRRYLYLRTGVLAKYVDDDAFISPFSDIIYVNRKNDTDTRLQTADPELGRRINSLEPEHYLIATRQDTWRKDIYIVGGDEQGTLYGAYRFAEHLGIRFYLHGDVIPDKKAGVELPFIEDIAQPLFDIRGIQPFHDFPEGPDWWNIDDYKAIIAQLPKLRMNFFGLHTYPEGKPNAEPSVWIGLPEDIGKNGAVDVSYPSSYQNTLRGNWGYAAKATGNFLFGGSELFERDDYSNDVMKGMCPEPKTPEDSNLLFQRAGNTLGEVFRYARSLGIKTCIGTETPLTVPKLVQERLESIGKDHTDSTVVQELYEGIFKRITETSPVDYYWFWTPEGWTWSGNTGKQVQATVTDLNAAMKARDAVGAPMELATCGWVLGPRNDRALFHRHLPGTMPMSCINRGVGTVAVDRAFKRVTGRPKWAIPWLEDDPGLTSVQLWAGRMRSDAVDALRYGCNGLLGIHWRTRILGPNVSALAQAAWDHEPWIKKPRVSGALEGHVMTPSERNIVRTDDDILYQTGRSGMFNYRFAAPNGAYAVTLRFCELEFRKRGARVFDVYIQDRKVIEKFDVFARAGAFRAYDVTFDDIEVGDGYLDIVFEPAVPFWEEGYGQACISAIEITGSGYSVKENCGGPAFKDFTADSALISRQKVNRDYLAGTSQWEYTPARHYDSQDFYRDWTLNQFGPDVSNEATLIFERMDGAMPRSSDWIGGPGGWKPDSVPWEIRSRDYAFVEEFAGLRGRVAGKGNIERFDYWLNNFRFMESSAKLCCKWAEFNSEMETVKAEKDSVQRGALAAEKALPAYVDMIKLLRETYGYLLAFVSNHGELGIVANVEQHIITVLLEETGRQLAEALGSELPREAVPSLEYSGEPRLIVPTLRTSCSTEDSLNLKVIVLDNKPPAQAELYWREMGAESFEVVPLSHVDCGVFTVKFPQAGHETGDIEYYIRAVTDSGKELVFPATAPEINQTVIMVENE